MQELSPQLVITDLRQRKSLSVAKLLDHPSLAGAGLAIRARVHNHSQDAGIQQNDPGHGKSLLLGARSASSQRLRSSTVPSDLSSGSASHCSKSCKAVGSAWPAGRSGRCSGGRRSGGESIAAKIRASCWETSHQLSIKSSPGTTAKRNRADHGYHPDHCGGRRRRRGAAGSLSQAAVPGLAAQDSAAPHV